MSNKPATNREFLAERDYRIFAMKKAGLGVREIAKRFDMTTIAVNKAVQRQLTKMNQEMQLDYSNVLRLELERLDALQSAIWAMTQNRKQTDTDGTELQLEPDLKAVTAVLSIMDRRTKLLGMDNVNVNVSMDVSSGAGNVIKATLAGQDGMSAPVNSFSPEEDARKLIELMTSSGVLPHGMFKELLSGSSDKEIIDAEMVEDGQITKASNE
jgi:hypothetical protein